MATGKPVELTNTGTPLSDADKRAGYSLVVLGPRNRNLHGDTTRSGIFHEFDDRHPNDGEALVVAGRVTKVFNTPTIAMAKAKGLLADSDDAETPTTSVVDAMEQNVASQQALAAKDAEIAALKALLAKHDAAQTAQTPPPAPVVTPVTPDKVATPPATPTKDK